MIFKHLLATVVLLWNLLIIIVGDTLRQLLGLSVKKSVTDDVILITGGGRGIGRNLALRLAKHGPKHIILWGRDQKVLMQTAREVQEQGVNCAFMVCDVTSREQVYSLAKEVEAKFGSVTMLVNNAGVVFAASVLNSDCEQVEVTMRTNILAHFWTTRAFLPAMIAQKKGHIVAISSVLALMGLNGAADYCCSKFAIDGFMDALRDELKVTGVSGVTLTTVYPYHVDNDMFAGASTRFPRIFPAISEDYLTTKVVDSILTGREKLVVPKLLYLSALFYRIAPVPAVIAIMKFIGGHKVMENVHGRKHIETCHSSNS